MTINHIGLSYLSSKLIRQNQFVYYLYINIETIDDMINIFLLALAEGFEFLAVVAQLPSIILMEVSRFFYSTCGLNNEDNTGEDE